MAKSTRDELAETAIQMGVSGGAAALATGASPAMAAFLAAVAPAAALFYGWTEDLARKRWAALLAAYFADVGPLSAEEMEEQLRVDGENPCLQEVLIETVRSVGEALDGAVVPALARLARRYKASGNRPDAFFRGMRRVLSDLDAEEFEALKLLVDKVLAIDLGESRDQVVLERAALEPGGTPQLSFVRPGPRSVDNERIGIGDVPRALRLFHLLKTNDLGTDSTGGGFTGHTGPSVIVLRFDIVRRIRGLLNH